MMTRPAVEVLHGMVRAVVAELHLDVFAPAARPMIW
jgi:hypothetical protein